MAHVYIDGYNFYCGINEAIWLKYRWCNFSKLAKRLAGRAFGPLCPVDEVKHDTGPVRLGRQDNRRGESERQQMWLDAVEGFLADGVVTTSGDVVDGCDCG